MAAFVVIAEYVGTTLLVDARDLARGFRLPGVEYLGEVTRGVALIAGATLLFGGSEMLRALRETLRGEPGSLPSRGYLVGHVAAFSLLVLLTLQVAYGASGGGVAWFVGWLALGLLALYLLLRFAVPIEQLRVVRAPLLRALGAGTAAGTAAWGAGKLATLLWPVVSTWTLRLAALQLGVFTSDIVVDAAELRLRVEAFEVIVAPVCSGLEGVGLAVVLAGTYVGHARRDLRFPNALLLVPMSAAIVWLANTTRIALLVLIGAWLSPAIAVSGFHSKAGWVFFIAIAFAMVWVSRRLPFFARQPARADELRDNPTLPYLAPLIALLASMMLTGLFAIDAFDPLYVVRVAVVLGVVGLLWRRYPAGTFRPSLVGAIFGVVTFVVWLLLSPFAGAAPMPSSLAALSPGLRGLWIAGRVAGGVVAVPIAEELAFRGYLLRRLQAHDFDADAVPRYTLLSFGGSSLLFALMHESEWLGALLAGMLFALAYLWRGRVGDAVWAHAICNGLVAAWVLFQDAWDLW